MSKPEIGDWIKRRCGIKCCGGGRLVSITQDVDGDYEQHCISSKGKPGILLEFIEDLDNDMQDIIVYRRHKRTLDERINEITF